MSILVTGANGWVGHAVCVHLSAAQKQVMAVARNIKSLSFSEQYKLYLCREEADFTQISTVEPLLSSVDVVVHCAARVHQLNDAASDPLEAYRHINCAATLALAQAAVAAGVRRFVFLSSVKVNGELTLRHQAFRAQDAAPQDPYGTSKWEAEQGLKAIAAKTGMEVVIIRPPLVYGPGVKANFHTMMRWLHTGIPLPLGAINNQRSLVALPNLVDFISLCVTHPKAANQTFMVSDQQDVSTTQLLRDLGAALHRPARLWPVRQSWLALSLQAIGKGGIAQRLCGDLTVDSSPATRLLGWTPPVRLQQGLQLTAHHFLASQTKTSA